MAFLNIIKTSLIFMLLNEVNGKNWKNNRERGKLSYGGGFYDVGRTAALYFSSNGTKGIWVCMKTSLGTNSHIYINGSTSNNRDRRISFAEYDKIFDSFIMLRIKNISYDDGGEYCCYRTLTSVNKSSVNIRSISPELLSFENILMCDSRREHLSIPEENITVEFFPENVASFNYNLRITVAYYGPPGVFVLVDKTEMKKIPAKFILTTDGVIGHIHQMIVSFSKDFYDVFLGIQIKEQMYRWDIEMQSELMLSLKQSKTKRYKYVLICALSVNNNDDDNIDHMKCRYKKKGEIL